VPHPPAPVHAFLACFLANPNAEALEDFRINLLELEVSRAQTVLPDLPDEQVDGKYRDDAFRALRVLQVARRRGWREGKPFDPVWFWLTLMGHRLALERGLSTGGIAALAEVASQQLDLPLEEARLWSCDMLFEKYTRTVLRTQWDYRGLQARSPQEA